MSKTTKQLSVALSIGLLLVAFNNCGPSGIRMLEEASSDLDLPGAGGSKPKFACLDPMASGKTSTEVRRLSYNEFVNTLRDLLGANVVAAIPSLERFPSDYYTHSIAEFGKNHTFQHVDTIVNISIEAAEALVNNSTALNAVAPNCIGTGLNSNNITNTCLRQFITQFGLRALRRPLSTAQVDSYAAAFAPSDSNLAGLSTADKLKLVVARILQAPDLHFHFLESTATVSSGRVKVDPYTLASRLSYRITGSSPDSALLTAAANNQLSTLEQVQAQAQRLMGTAGARRQFRQMVSYWLKLDAVAAPAIGPTGRMGFATDGATRNKIKDEVVQELLDFAEYIVFNQNGTFDDLMNSPLSFPKTAEMAKILGVTLPNGGGPVNSVNGRRGLLTRPALLLSNLDRERVIHRGFLVRSRILCDIIPQPPANADQIAADNVASISPHLMSVRDVTAATTRNPSCIGCHSQINPLGFALGKYGQLGEFRAVESVFDQSGALTAQFTPDTRGENLNVVNYTDVAADEQGLIDLVSNSAKAKACLPQQLFRYANLRLENPSLDGCGLSLSEMAVYDRKPIKEVMLAIFSSEEIFWKGQ